MGEIPQASCQPANMQLQRTVKRPRSLGQRTAAELRRYATPLVA